jgi:GH43 family beta-xylosidase
MPTVYRNPVLSAPCPDPFVLNACGEYRAYGSGLHPDGRAFSVFTSPDLVDWTARGGALVAWNREATCWWAPEVILVDGRFYLYYSVGNEALMEIRVAVSDDPDGPFIDSGHRLTSEPFAIDPHVFSDADGERWLFYATDFTEDEPIGTAIVVDRMRDLFSLEGRPRMVTRAEYDWQVYDPHRKEKGGVRWHTVEGPFVLRHKGLYYEMFSAGNWTNSTYGVSYATSDTLRADRPWRQHCDGVRTRPVLATIPGKVVGPGHNSAVLGPDGLQMFCVYHRWSEEGTERQLSIDRLDWAGERLLVLGPSMGDQSAPIRPGLRLADGLENWTRQGGRWDIAGDELIQRSLQGEARASRPLPSSSVVIQAWLRSSGHLTEGLIDPGPPLPRSDGSCAIGLEDDDGPLFICRLGGDHAELVHGEGRMDRVRLADFSSPRFHAVRLALDVRRLTVWLDDNRILWRGVLARPPAGVALLTDRRAVSLKAATVTEGWEETFSPIEGDNVLDRWEVVEGSGDDWQVADSLLWYGPPPPLHGCAVGDETPESSPDVRPGAITRGPALAAYELVVNIRARQPRSHGWRIDAMVDGLSCWPCRGPNGWVLECSSGERAPLPARFDPCAFHQYRFRKTGTRLTVAFEAEELLACAVPDRAARVGLAARSACAVDLVRVTALPA